MDEEEAGAAGYDSDATLPIEGEYAYATEEEKAAQRLLLRTPDAPRESEEDEGEEAIEKEEEAMEV
jgi:hypothetical protein